MSRAVFHVIMAGGSGTRFWPLGRVTRPKQFLTLVGDRPLIRQAFDRAASMSGSENVYVAAGRVHQKAVERMLPGFETSHYIAEPCARNTAPCIGLAALHLARIDPEAILIISPADHVYSRPEILGAALGCAVRAAKAPGALVTLGITPSHPATGYGYIQVASTLSSDAAVAVEQFIEKPNIEKAREFLTSGRHLWNSGVFVWRIDSILHAIKTCAPDLWTGLQAIEAAFGGPERERVLEATFKDLTPTSIDYAVMEEAEGVLVVPMDPGWSDVGSWDAIEQLCAEASDLPEDDQAQVLQQDASACYVHVDAEARRVIALVGVKDLIVVDTQDALLVCHKGASEAVREVVRELRRRKRHDLL